MTQSKCGTGKSQKPKLDDGYAHSLPEKFGVTKGYVVFPKVGKFEKLTEYDVIIYDKNEAPVTLA